MTMKKDRRTVTSANPDPLHLSQTTKELRKRRTLDLKPNPSGCRITCHSKTHRSHIIAAGKFCSGRSNKQRLLLKQWKKGFVVTACTLCNGRKMSKSFSFSLCLSVLSLQQQLCQHFPLTNIHLFSFSFSFSSFLVQTNDLSEGENMRRVNRR